MVSPMNFLGKLRLAVCLAAPLAGAADVVTNDAVLFAQPGGAALGLALSIPVGEGACAFLFQQGEGLSTVISGYSIAELCELFEVAPGDVFDAAYVAAHAPVVSNSGVPESTVIAAGVTTKVFGYWDDRLIWNVSNTPGVPDAYDNYGWAAVAFEADEDGGTVSWRLLDGATARGGGIVVGTYTAVPEPASYGLAGGLAALVWVARRRR
jgi:hypothetical protein